MTFRFTITVTPMTDAELEDVIDVIRARYGRKHLIHVLAKQPASSNVNEAPVARQIAAIEREYVIALNAVLASNDETADVNRWCGHAEANRQVCELLRRDFGLPPVRYQSAEWRAKNGVYSDEQVTEFRRLARA